MTTLERELKPLNCGQKSFYHKAIVIEDTDNNITVYMALKSYNTIVVDVDFVAGKVYITIKDMYSKTTKRHIRDFIIQLFGMPFWYKVEQGYSNGETSWTL